MRTTLNRLYAEGAPGYCMRGWNVLLTYLDETDPNDEPLAMNTILDAIGLTGAIWCLRGVDDCEKEKEIFSEFLKGERTLEEMKIKFLECFGD